MRTKKETRKFIKRVKIVRDNKQVRLPVPDFIVQFLDIDKGDEFSWYLERKKDKIILSGELVHRKYGKNIHFPIKKGVSQND